MPKFYCQYCGTYAISIQSLTARRCVRHPFGVNKGNCALYEGSEKANTSANSAAAARRRYRASPQGDAQGTPPA
ncbi:MAG: hypothetical protein IJ717_01655 [Treponema sp.]|nr:hypothetical protein [Treponema sp.]